MNQRPLIFLFPGQASQYVGMGKDLYAASAAARAVFDRVTRLTGLGHIGRLAFDGPDELLTRTDNVQPAITLVSIMALEALREQYSGRVAPVACAGHSLGEYAAHYAAGNLDLNTVFTLVRRRGEWMNEASQPPHPVGAMLAVIGLELPAVQLIVEAVGLGELAIANLNSPGQIILSGTDGAVARAAEMAAKSGAKRIVRLNVSGAWHSPLMQPAKEKMGTLLDELYLKGALKVTDTPVVANFSADVIESPEAMRDTLREQITAPVRWESCVQRLINLAKSTVKDDKIKPLFIEIGPGKVLKGLLRNIDRNLDCLNAGTWDEIIAVNQSP